jgi:small subunit ribosomal protein S4
MAAARRSGAGSEGLTTTMARYTGADCKRCRREKTKLFLKGAKCDSPKCPIEIRPYPPGEHGRNRPKESEYLLQVREKQKARRIYGILEKQFQNYYTEAAKTRGKTGEALLQILESRLDNVIYRAGFAKSRDMARQVVRHGHVLVNGRKVDIPSFRVSDADIIEIAAKSRELTPFVVARAEAGERPVPAWLEVIPDKMRILVHTLPSRTQIDTLVQEQLIVEYYSK